MIDLFLPNEQIKEVYDINPEQLTELGIKGLVVDLDNTLIPWNVSYASPKVRAWFDSIITGNIQVIVFSNNQPDRVATFAYPIGLPYIAKAKKPLTKSFKSACEQMELDVNEVAIVGDQLLTDIFGGNMAGLYTILVDPIVKSDAPITQFNRKIEGLLLKRFYKKGQLARRQIND